MTLAARQLSFDAIRPHLETVRIPQRKAPPRKRKPSKATAIRRALKSLKDAEADRAPQQTLRERYRTLERLLDDKSGAQLELNLEQIVSARRLERLHELGQDPHPDSPFETSAIADFADYFPDGMSFAEIAWVLGLKHKQHAFKIYQRGVAKMLRAMGRSSEDIREALRSRDAHVSAWDSQVVGYG